MLALTTSRETQLNDMFADDSSVFHLKRYYCQSHFCTLVEGTEEEMDALDHGMTPQMNVLKAWIETHDDRNSNALVAPA